MPRRSACAGRIALVLVLAGDLFCGAAFAADQTATWTGGGDGISWTDPDNWSTDVFPNNDGLTFDAVIGEGFDAEIGDTEIVIEAMGLGSGATLRVGDPDAFGFEPFKLNADSTNDGILTLFDTELWIESDLMLDGAGEVVLTGNNGGSLISQSNAALTIAAGHTVRTEDTAFLGRMFGFSALTNQGAIESVGSELRLTAFGDQPLDLTNTGLLRAREQGLLALQGVHIDQTGGGTMTVDADSALRITSFAGTVTSRVTGGTIDGGGTVEAFAGTFDGVTLGSGLTFEATGPTFTNTLTNDADIRVLSNGSIEVQGSTTVDGQGTIQFVNKIGGSSGGEIVGDEAAELTLGADQTLLIDQQQAVEAESEVDIVSDGTVDLQAGELRLVESTLTNRNLVHIRDGATLELFRGGLATLGGTLTIDSEAMLLAGAFSGGGEEVRFEDATLNGTAENIDADSIPLTFAGDNTLNVPVTSGTVTVEGPAVVNGGGGLIDVSFTGDGTDDALTLGSDQSLTIESGGTFDVPLTNHAPVQVNTGTLTFNEPVQNNGVITIDPSGTATLNINAGLTGTGQIALAGGQDGSVQFTGVETVAHGLSGNGRVTFDARGAPDDTTTVTGAYTNTGTTVFDGGTVIFPEPVDTLASIDVRGRASFTAGLNRINELLMGGFGDRELFIDGDTTVDAIVGNVLAGTLSGPGTTTLQSEVAFANATFDGRTVVAEDDVTVHQVISGAGLDLVNGARLINNSADTLRAGDTGAGLIASSDGTGVLENRGRVTNGVHRTGDIPLGLRIGAFYEQTESGINDTDGFMEFTGGGNIDGQVVSRITDGGLTFTTGGDEVTYAFPETSGISGEGNLIFDGSDFNGDGSLTATVEGTVELTGENSVTTIQDGAEALVTGDYRLTGGNSETRVTSGATATFPNLDQTELGERLVIDGATVNLGSESPIPEPSGAAIIQTAAETTARDDDYYEGVFGAYDIKEKSWLYLSNGTYNAQEVTLLGAIKALAFEGNPFATKLIVANALFPTIVPGAEFAQIDGLHFVTHALTMWASSWLNLACGSKLETTADSGNEIEAGGRHQRTTRLRRNCKV